MITNPALPYVKERRCVSSTCISYAALTSFVVLKKNISRRQQNPLHGIVITFLRIELTAIKLKPTRGWALERVYNSRRPLDRLQYDFALCDPVTLTFDFWPNINWWARYPCAKFSDFSFNRFGLIVLIDRQNHTKSQTRMIATVDVSNLTKLAYTDVGQMAGSLTAIVFNWLSPLYGNMKSW